MPDPTEKHSLQRQAKKSDNFRALLSSAGFKEFREVLNNLHDEYYARLLEGEDANARAGIRNLYEIADRIDSTIKLGEEARERLKHPIFNREGTD